MQEIAVAVFEENQTVALVVIGFAQEFDAASGKLRQCLVKIIHGDGQVPDARLSRNSCPRIRS
jgi:hypothetical protein